MAESSFPILPPIEAIRWFIGKGLARSFAWEDIWQAQHDHYFTVAKMLETSLLEEVHGLIGEALQDGRSPQGLAKNLKSLLRERGWWGRQEQTDPLTGEKQTVQLGSNRRVRTIVNTNLRTSYGAGRYARQERVKSALPILVYKSRMDGRERPQHHAWHDTALPFDHVWWRTHYPPCDWGCRCRTVSMTKGQAARRNLKVGEEPAHFGTRTWVNKRTGEVIEVEKGIGAGWDYHPGRSQIEGLAPEPLFGFSRTDGDQDAIAAAEPSAIGRFLDRFGLPGTGGVWRDATGWPLALSRRWLHGLSRARQAQAASAAIAVASPDEIRLLWVTGKDGRGMLMRRYLFTVGSAGYVVDVGARLWRFGRADAAQLARLRASGHLAWSREALAEASYNPRQPRDRKGRWTSRGASFIAQAIADPASGGSHWLGRVSSHVKERLAQLGIKARATVVMVESGRARHIHGRHGKDSRGQKPVTAKDILLANHVLDIGTINHGNPRQSGTGIPRIFVTAHIDGATYGASFEVGRRRINLITMWKR